MSTLTGSDRPSRATVHPCARGAPQATLSVEAGGSAGGSDGGSDGGVSSETVTSKLPEVPLPEASVAVHVTVVAPTGNVEPEAGRQ